MEKLYDRIDWNNNTTPALNETNLNAMSKAIDDIDDRVIEIAGDVLVVVPEILDKYADIEALTTNPPYIGQNGHWWTWDTDTNQYVDSGVDAGVSVTVGSTTTLAPGSSATVTNSGTDTDPILNFGIPQGATGQNGADGVGVPSGGTTGQVLKKKTSTDYDTEWANESGGGSGGHTIINSAGTDMTQRDGLQFSGLNVTDDSGNDKTVVTLPTPDYVDAQYNSSTTYSKGMTCISGNVRYRYKNNTASSGHQPPDATYWEEYSVTTEIGGFSAVYPVTSGQSIFVGNLGANDVYRLYKHFTTETWAQNDYKSFSLSEIPNNATYITIDDRSAIIAKGAGGRFFITNKVGATSGVFNSWIESDSSPNEWYLGARCTGSNSVTATDIYLWVEYWL